MQTRLKGKTRSVGKELRTQGNKGSGLIALRTTVLHLWCCLYTVRYCMPRMAGPNRKVRHCGSGSEAGRMAVLILKGGFGKKEIQKT